MTDTTIKLNRRNIRSHIGGLAKILTLDGFRRLDLMVYGGGALILASNFREETWDVDAFIHNTADLPIRKNIQLEQDALRLGWAADEYAKYTQLGIGWLDNSIYNVFDKSSVNIATKQNHIFIETIPHDPPIFDVYVPDKNLLLAMKVKAMRIDAREELGEEKPKDLNDLINLLALHPEIKNEDQLLNFSAKFFPDIRERENVVTGAKRLFTEFRDRRPHPGARYAAGSRPEP